MNIRHFTFNPYQENTILIWDDSLTGVIIDPGCCDSSELEQLKSFVADKGIKPAAILLTHAHFDHIYGVKGCVEAYGTPVYMHPDDKVMKDNAAALALRSFMPAPDCSWDTVDICDDQTLTFGGMTLKVITTPGHSPGSVCFLCAESGDLFCGDTLFAGTIGRTDLPGGDYDHEIVSIMDKIMGLDGDVDIHPGHGGMSNIGHERTHNPFLQPFNEKDEDSGEVEGIEISGF